MRNRTIVGRREALTTLNERQCELRVAESRRGFASHRIELVDARRLQELLATRYGLLHPHTSTNGQDRLQGSRRANDVVLGEGYAEPVRHAVSCSSYLQQPRSQLQYIWPLTDDGGSQVYRLEAVLDEKSVLVIHCGREQGNVPALCASFSSPHLEQRKSM